MAENDSGEVLKPILLRSTTPASNEKVLNFLEGIARAGDADHSPPQSIADHDEYRAKAGSPRNGQSGIYSPTPKSRHSDALHELANSPVSYENHAKRPEDNVDDNADVSSVLQEGSEAAETILPMREPGPHDGPAPYYESYSSWGNMGPLPTEDHPNAPHMSTWTPAWNNQGAGVPWNLETGAAGGLTPGAQVPLPESVMASPRATSVNIGVESPSDPASRAQTAQKQPSVTSGRNYGPPSPTKSRAATDQRPLSPLSQKSRVTARTRATDKGTAYPALPESRLGDEDVMSYDSPVSPTRSKAHRSKAASVSPSDSPSQTKVHQSSRKHASTMNKSDLEANLNGAEFSPRSGSRQIPQNGNSRSQAPNSVLSGGHQSRPFSPYRHAPTTEDLLYAAVRGRSLAIPEEEPEKSPSHHSKAPSAVASARSKQPSQGRAPSHLSMGKAPSVTPSKHTRGSQIDRESNATPRPRTPDDLNEEERRIVQQALASATPRTSFYSPSTLDPDVVMPYHDNELCQLLSHLNQPGTPDAVKKAVRKGVKQRVKKLGMRHDNESIRQYELSHNHDHGGLRSEYADEPPQWASDIKREIVLMQQRIEGLGPKIENLRDNQAQSYGGGGGEASKYYDGEDYTQTPKTQTINIHTQPTGTLADSIFQGPDTEALLEEEEGMRDEDGEQEFDDITETQQHRAFPHTHTDGSRNGGYAASDNRDDSPGQQFLEEELYKLRQRPKPHGSQSGASHATWEVARDDKEGDYDEAVPAIAPTIPGSDVGYGDNRSLPGLPNEDNRSLVATPSPWGPVGDYNETQQQLPPWQKIHQRLLSWAIIWPSGDLDTALNSTTRGHQVNEVALSIWSTQTYKRYVRSRLTDSPQGVVDRLFVPPNVADAINTAVFNGRHGDACGMLRDLWSPFGLEGMPRLLVVLAKHRSDENHWVVHRFSLPDGALTTYDSYPERTLPDGRPLGWWFAIRIAWPNAIYLSPDHLMQKMVRLHRPMQLPIDNSVAAGGIWRNILMGSRAERSLDLERLRDLINTEVKNLRQRKQLGKLSIAPPRPTWEDMN